MVLKLKTYVTSIGFFEQAVAAPSMKAALEAWGSGQNLFHQGFAKETSDPAIIKATMQQPGVVLKRPVGSEGIFKIHAELPKADLLNKPHEKIVPENKIKPAAKHSAKANKKDLERDRKAAEAYKREEKRKRQQRQKQEAIHKKLRKKREAILIKTKLAALKKSEKAHDRKIQVLKNQQAAINKKIDAEEMSWNNEKERWEVSIDKLNEFN